MRRASDLSSPVSTTRKRRRMSSPSLDAQFPALSQEQLKEIDEIEARLSQEARSTPPGFVNATALHTTSSEPSSSQDLEPPEKDYSDWFKPANDMSIGFQTASATMMNTGFRTSKAAILPSAEALAKAKVRMAQWQEKENHETPPPPQVIEEVSRPVFRPLVNASPSTPSPVGMRSSALPTFASPLADKSKRSFKSPVIEQPMARIPVTEPTISFINSRSQHPLASSPITSDSSHLPPMSFQTPVRSKGRNTPARFVTPFKPGMRPGEPGRKLLDEQNRNKTPATSGAITAPHKLNNVVFDLIPKGRKTLLSSGLRPQRYTTDEVEAMGIDTSDLTQISPSSALFYAFFDNSNSTPAPNSLGQLSALNSDTALMEMLNRGCHLATKPWVDNHYCLILWKLAGMVLLDPHSEKAEATRRWCWREMIKQLFYRYERESNKGLRSPLRQIAAHDAPASYPMVLCISAVYWPETQKSNSLPELEITDGWYRLRALIDQPLARALCKGKLRQGQKITVVGASLSERKDPVEILEAYNSIKLVLNGNASRLAPWHEKLGFKKTSPICSLHSLNPDGGIVPAMDIVVLEVYPLFFVEFVEKNGQRKSLPAKKQFEEDKEVDKWTRRREIEEAKLRAEYEKKQIRYLSYADRLERRAPANFVPTEDDMPDHLDNLYDELEDAQGANKVIGCINTKEAGWLAHYIRKQLEKEQERLSEEIEKELNDMIPPRLVYSARILVVEDAQSYRYPANRRAQVTVWDVTRLELTDGKPPGYFEAGQRFHASDDVAPHSSEFLDGTREGGSDISMYQGFLAMA